MHGFLSGKLVDESGLPALTASFTVVTEGSFQGQRGFVTVQGDHKVRSDGTFVSPPLSPGRYFLRFFGMLQSAPASAAHGIDRQSRVFDFVYSDAVTVLEGLPFDLEAGETMSSVFRVPEPHWFNIGGCVKEGLPVALRNLVILFQRNMGILPDVGGTGIPVKADGSFDGALLRGSYVASLHEFTDPEPDGYARSLRQFGSAAVIIERDILNLELQMR